LLAEVKALLSIENNAPERKAEDESVRSDITETIFGKDEESRTKKLSDKEVLAQLELAREEGRLSEAVLKDIKESFFDKNSDVMMTQEGLEMLIAQSQQRVEEAENQALAQLNSGINNSIEYTTTGSGSVIIQAGSAEVIGSDVVASDNIVAKTDVGSIEVRAMETNSTSYTKDEDIKIGVKDALKGLVNPLLAVEFSGRGVSVNLGEATYDKVDVETESTHHVGSNLHADGTVALISEEDIVIEGSNVSAGEDVVLDAQGDVKVVEAKDSSSTKTKETHAKAEVSVSATHSSLALANALKEVKEAKEQLQQAKRDYKRYKRDLKRQKKNLAKLKQELAEGKAGVTQEDIDELSELIEDIEGDKKYYIASISTATANLSSKITLAYQATAGVATSAGTLGFSASLDLDIDGTKSETSSSSTRSVGSNISAGNSVKVTTGRVLLDENGEVRRDANGEILRDKNGTSVTIKGSNIYANDTIDIKTEELNILASQDESSSQTDSTHINGHASVSTSGGVSVSMSGDKSHSRNSQTTHTNSTLNAKNIKLNSTKDTNIKGANIHGTDSTTLDVGGDLNVASVQERTKSSNHSMGASAGVSGSGGDVSGVNGGANTSNGRSSTKTTLLTTVTGGTLTVNVKGNTDNRGALVASGEFNSSGEFVDNGKLSLNTGTFTHSDLTNRENSSSTSASLNVNTSLSGKKVNPNDPTSKDEKDVKINTSQVNASNNSHSSKSKSLATIGEGNITIGGERATEDRTLNRDVDKTDKEIYDVNRTKANINLTVDHRLLSKEGHKAIKEDIERTNRLGESIYDVATKDAFKVKDTIDHIDEVQKELDVQKAMALEGGGKYIEALEGKNSTPEEKQEALTKYAEIYARIYGISIEKAKVIAIGKYAPKGATHNQEGNNNIYINDDAQGGATDYGRTMGHEVTHARINQGTTRDRSEGVDEATGHRLNEEYADTMGNYSAEGLEFTNNTYTNNAPITQNSHSNTHSGNGDSETIKKNTKEFVQTTVENPDEMEYSHFTPADISRFKSEILQKEDELDDLILDGEGDSQEAKELRAQIKKNKAELAKFGDSDEAIENNLAKLNQDLDKKQVEGLKTLVEWTPTGAFIFAVEDGIKDGSIVTMVVEDLILNKVEKVFKVGDKLYAMVKGDIVEVSKESWDKIKKNSN